MAYCVISLYRLLQNKESFLISFREQYKDNVKLEHFIAFFVISSTFFWPLVMLGEISNKKDLE